MDNAVIKIQMLGNGMFRATSDECESVLFDAQFIDLAYSAAVRQVYVRRAQNMPYPCTVDNLRP